MIDMLHDLKDPKPWDLWYSPYCSVFLIMGILLTMVVLLVTVKSSLWYIPIPGYGVLQDLYHQPYPYGSGPLLLSGHLVLKRNPTVDDIHPKGYPIIPCMDTADDINPVLPYN